MIFQSTLKDFHVNNCNFKHISLSLGVCVADGGETQVRRTGKANIFPGIDLSHSLSPY